LISRISNLKPFLGTAPIEAFFHKRRVCSSFSQSLPWPVEKLIAITSSAMKCQEIPKWDYRLVAIAPYKPGKEMSLTRVGSGSVFCLIEKIRN